MSSDSTLKKLTIIEDDIDLGKAMVMLFRSAGFETVIFSSAEEFLEQTKSIKPKVEKKKQSTKVGLECLLIDVRLPNMNGLELFERMKTENKICPPVIFLTGHGDIDMGVSAIKNGAFDFITKPIKTEELLKRIEDAMKFSREIQKERTFIQLFETRLETLTLKETEILGQIIRGSSNKQISEKLDNSIRTVELHRARILKKMNTSNAIELTRDYERYNQLNDYKSK